MVLQLYMEKSAHTQAQVRTLQTVITEKEAWLLKSKVQLSLRFTSGNKSNSKRSPQLIQA
jgi:hypothetical protein